MHQVPSSRTIAGNRVLAEAEAPWSKGHRFFAKKKTDEKVRIYSSSCELSVSVQVLTVFQTNKNDSNLACCKVCAAAKKADNPRRQRLRRLQKLVATENSLGLLLATGSLCLSNHSEALHGKKNDCLLQVVVVG